tara:strand:- start:17784 stop:18971 length:1188 start_codon:yes stop_codon:yes gene_type:complete
VLFNKYFCFSVYECIIYKTKKLKATEKKIIIDLIHAGLIGDTKRVELAALSLARSVKNDSPEMFDNIKTTLSSYSLTGGTNIRSAGTSPIPIDGDSKLEMAIIYKPDAELNVLPILPANLMDRVNGFIDERNKIDILIENDIKPSTSLLLIGQPGTGKTMLAKHIASVLNKNLIVLDLSSSMSSLMGKTGSNLKRVLQYAKQSASVLLFDEFDAIAKKRDDNTDLGEIKRVVNILLMELEDWPISSIFIATTNHPELLDKAIWRRFDHTLNFPMPEKNLRLKILEDELKDFLILNGTSADILKPISEMFEGKSAADLCKYANNVKRRFILRDEKPLNSLFNEIEDFQNDKKLRAKFCVIAKDLLGSALTMRELSELTGLSISGVNHHISKTKNHE